MLTNNQLKKKKRKIFKNLKSKTYYLEGNPQKKGICLKVTWVAPKKPNSARRKIAWVNLLSTNEKIACKIPGEFNNLQQYSIVLVRGGRTKDIPGMQYKLIRGKYDASGVPIRMQGRSKFGTKRWRGRLA